MTPLPLNVAPRFCVDCGRDLGPRDAVTNGWPCTGCGVHTFVDPKVAACCLPWHEGRLVLVKRGIEPRKGFYSSPGGYCERGEPPHHAAMRETLEETGLVVESKELLGVFATAGSPVIVIYYDCEIVSGWPPRALSEVQEIGLFKPEEIPWERLAFSSVSSAICASIAHRARRAGS
ncbi:MAG: NUDIX domain-containing protein [Planctomycetota bacterium]